MSDAVKVVVVGCGGMANTWVGEAMACPRIEVVGLVDMRREAAEAMAAKHELPPSLVHDTLERAVQATKADAVFDVTIPAAHASVTLEALSLGCHVLGEKPMSETLESARQMVEAAEAAGRSYAVTQTRRPLPGFMGITAFLADGGLGQVAELHSDFYLGAHFGGFRDAMAQPLLLDMAIHTFDNARQMLGPGVVPSSVYCHAFNPAHSWYGHEASARRDLRVHRRDRLLLPRLVVCRGPLDLLGEQVARHRRAGHAHLGRHRPAAGRGGRPGLTGGAVPEHHDAGRRPAAGA